MCSADIHGSVRGSTSLIVRDSVASFRIRTYNGREKYSRI